MTAGLFRFGLKSTLAIFLVAFSIEIAFRIFFATMVGPSVLLYGMDLNHRTFAGDDDAAAKADWVTRGQIAEGEKHNVSVHANVRADYSTYFPNQVRYDFDKDTQERFEVTINNRGFRGADFSTNKEAGVVRIAVLGASSTFGYHSRDHQTYPVYLSEILNSHQCVGVERFDVINLGIPHLRSENILALFLAEGLPLQPDIVTFYEGVNDTRVKAGVAGKFQRMALPRRIYQFARQYSLAVKFADSFLVKRNKRYSPGEVTSHIDGKSDVFLANLDSLYHVTRDHGMQLIVANQQAKSKTIPRQEMKGLTYDQEADQVRAILDRDGEINQDQLSFLTHQSLMRGLPEWANDRDIPFVDVINAMDQRRDHLLTWVHLAPGGNRIVAEALAPAILEKACGHVHADGGG